MKNITFLFIVSIISFPGILYAQDYGPKINMIYSELPTITTFEKFCILTSETGVKFEACINSLPKTELYKRALQKSRAHIDLLNKLSISVNDGSGFPLDDPWISFCVINSKPECLDDCINGFVCPSE